MRRRDKAYQVGIRVTGILVIKLKLPCKEEIERPADGIGEHGYPALYRAANAHSITQQKRFFRVLLAELVFLIIASVLSILNIPLAAIAYAQAAVLVLTLACAIYLFWTKPDRRWYAARAVAESVKTTAWRYAIRAEPFDVGDDAARELFKTRLRRVLDHSRELAQRFSTNLTDAQITARMEELRAASFEQRRQVYVDGRVDEQRHWYAYKATLNDCLGKWFFGALVVAILGSLGLALGKIAYPSSSYWPTDALITIASVLVTWVQSRRFSELAASYTLAAYEIGIIHLDALNLVDDRHLSHFVGDAENAFSREHTQWVARKDE